MITKFINFFAGPSTGKSTSAAGLFYKLKLRSINSEYVSEFAKDCVWGQDYKKLELQPYILGKQLYKQYRLIDKVDFVITDSPILFSVIYKGFGCVEGFDEVVVKQFNLFNNINIFLQRNTEDHPYNPSGRMQTEVDAMAIDNDVRGMLDHYNIPYHIFKVDKEGKYLDQIIDLILNV